MNNYWTAGLGELNVMQITETGGMNVLLISPVLDKLINATTCGLGYFDKVVCMTEIEVSVGRTENIWK